MHKRPVVTYPRSPRLGAPDPIRLSKTVAFLLRHRPEVGNLRLDADGWTPLTELCAAASRLLRFSVGPNDLVRLVESSDVRRFEISGERIRALQRPQARRGSHRVWTPDILYHATTAKAVDTALDKGHLEMPDGRAVFMSNDEAQAWRAAHRFTGSPRLIVVDTTRARRSGVHFRRHRRNGMFLAPGLPARALLNLQRGYAEQHSAGGFPIVLGADGTPRLALIQVERRSGTTWEVAKGKLEPGETPEMASAREVGEEMGITAPLRVVRRLQTVRYGFLAPGGLPRLKIVYMYLLAPTAPITSFVPADAEGIAAVRWFTPDEAVRAVTHTSLQPVMRHLKQLLRYGLNEPLPSLDTP